MPQTINNMVQEWTNALTTYTAIKMNIPTDVSAAGSLLMDLQVGSSSRFQVRKDGSFYAVPSGEARFGYVGSVNTLAVGSGGGIGFSSLSYVPTAAIDVLLTRRAAANLRLGAADAAAPVAQTLSVQSASATGADQAGANFTITGSQGRGGGAGGSIIFQVAPAGTPGSGAVNALVDALIIPAAAAGGSGSSKRPIILNGGTPADSPVLYPGAGGSLTVGRQDDSTPRAAMGIITTSSRVGFITSDGGIFAFSSSTTNLNTADTILTRDAANTLALRNGAAAQNFNVYNTHTSSTNYEAINIGWDSNNAYIGATIGSVGGTRRPLRLFGSEVDFLIGATTVSRIWLMNSSGHFLAGADNSYDIGATSSGRPRNVYVAGDVTAAGAVVAGASQKFQISGRINYSSPAAGVAEMRTPALGAGTVYLGQNTVANLPSASSYAGALAFVSDATATTARSTVAGGGSNKVMVMSDGTNWLIVA